MSARNPDLEAVVEHAREHGDRFRRAVDATDPDRYMMWYSELFVFASLCELLDCGTVIESGRARGVSTLVLSNYFRESDVTITSIDNRPHSEDAEYAEARLADADNVTLRYGDSREVVPEIAGPKTAVLIDGPKGDAALGLGLDLLGGEDVPVVGIHDLHRDTFYRDLSELLFDHRLYTDEETIVDEFGQYDAPYFEWYNSAPGTEVEAGPYLKGGERSNSYGPTLGVFFHGGAPYDDRVRRNFESYVRGQGGPLSDVGDRLRATRARGGPVARRGANLLLSLWE